jgi:hypothetical protein
MPAALRADGDVVGLKATRQMATLLVPRLRAEALPPHCIALHVQHRWGPLSAYVAGRTGRVVVAKR